MAVAVAVLSCDHAEIIPNPGVGEPGYLDPDWHPREYRIVYYYGPTGVPQRLEELNSSGTQVIYTSGGFHPSWHPTLDLIAFSAGRLAVLNVETEEVRFLSDGGGITTSPAWSPDGTTIAYETNEDAEVEGYRTVKLWDVANGGSRDVMDAVELIGANYPAWHPSGDTLLVSVPFAINSVRSRTRLLLIDLVRSDTSYVSPADADAEMADWHPSGNYVVYMRSQPGERGEMWLLDVRDGTHHYLTDNGLEPSWSPSGAEFVFSRWTPEGVELWTYNVLTREERRLLGN